MSRQADICRAVTAALKETFSGVLGVTVTLEDKCNPALAIEDALAKWGVLVMVSASGHRRKPGTGASTAGDLAIDLTVIENPGKNRKSGVDGPTVTSVAEAAKDALHWRTVEGRRIVYVEMQRADVDESDYRMQVSFVALAQTPGMDHQQPTANAEPEEIVEARVVALLSGALPGWAVIGALAPAADGGAKRIPDTCVLVTADMSSQLLDWCGPGVPCDYTVRAEVRCSEADDETGVIFRDTCRAVRAALETILGDGCSRLDGDGFECDSFRLAPTSTKEARSDDDSGKRKTYSASVTGRYHITK